MINEIVPHRAYYLWDQFLKDAESRGHKLGANLARAANEAGMTPADVAQFPKLLKPFKLKPDKITPLIIHQANAIFNEHSAWLAKFEVDWNRRYGYSEEFVKEDKPESRSRTSLYGYPITAVIRWMGTDCWDFEEARAAFKALNIPVADATIRAQLRAGERGERGNPAPINSLQAKELYNAAK